MKHLLVNFWTPVFFGQWAEISCVLISAAAAVDNMKINTGASSGL